MFVFWGDALRIIRAPTSPLSSVHASSVHESMIECTHNIITLHCSYWNSAAPAFSNGFVFGTSYNVSSTQCPYNDTSLLELHIISCNVIIDTDTKLTKQCVAFSRRFVYHTRSNVCYIQCSYINARIVHIMLNCFYWHPSTLALNY